MPRRPPMIRPSASVPHGRLSPPSSARRPLLPGRHVGEEAAQALRGIGPAAVPGLIAVLQDNHLMDGREQGTLVGRVIFWAGSYLQVCSLRTAKWR